MPKLKIKSDFAIVDVKQGRIALANHFADRPAMGKCPPAFRVPITLTGYLDCIHSLDDGESREFAMTVTKVAIKQPQK